MYFTKIFQIHETLSEIVYNSGMLTYTTLKDRSREFLAATGLTHAEFARVLPVFTVAYGALSPPDKTLPGKRRQRQVGGGTTGRLSQMEDQLRFLLGSQKTHPLPTLHGLPCRLRHSPTPYGMQHLLPVLPRA